MMGKWLVGKLVYLNGDVVMSERFFYGIGAYGYEDYEEHILFHTQKFSYDEFLEIVKEAQKKSKKYHSYSYSQNVLNCLCEEFGFEKLGYPLVDIGCSRKSEVTLERFNDE